MTASARFAAAAVLLAASLASPGPAPAQVAPVVRNPALLARIDATCQTSEVKARIAVLDAEARRMSALLGGQGDSGGAAVLQKLDPEAADFEAKAGEAIEAVAKVNHAREPAMAYRAELVRARDYFRALSDCSVAPAARAKPEWVEPSAVAPAPAGPPLPACRSPAVQAEIAALGAHSAEVRATRLTGLRSYASGLRSLTQRYWSEAELAELRKLGGMLETLSLEILASDARAAALAELPSCS